MISQRVHRRFMGRRTLRRFYMTIVHVSPTPASLRRHLALRFIASLMLLVGLAACTTSGGGEPSAPTTQGTLEVAVTPATATVSITQSGAVAGILQGAGVIALPAGDYQVTATATDHEPRTVAATITAGQTRSLPITLAPISRMRFEGEWLWIALFSSGLRYEGFLSVSTPLADSSDGSIRNAEGGIWRWCTLGVGRCPNPTGVGFFADYEDEWMVAFSEVPTNIKLIGFDEDGELRLSSNPTFASSGGFGADDEFDPFDAFDPWAATFADVLHSNASGTTASVVGDLDTLEDSTRRALLAAREVSMGR
jgi:hypothetical protein